MKKSIEFVFDGQNYICILEGIDKENINLEIKDSEFPKFKTKFNWKDIYRQIAAFEDYSVGEFFSALDDLT